ncbi:MAG: alpha/beta hydrolase [Anaerolineae bacterium]
MTFSIIAKILAGILLGGTIVTIIGPMVGEIIATLPPIFPPKEHDPLTVLGLSYENVAFPTADGLTLRGWWIPAGAPNAPAVIYAPGTGHDQRSGLPLAGRLHQAGYHVLLFSYRGYGGSDGDEFGFTYGQRESEDIDAAVRFLKEQKGIRAIGVIGFSAGAASAILSAARNPDVQAVVAAASFTTVSEVWDTNMPAFIPPFFREWLILLAEWRKGFQREAVEPIKVVGKIAPRPLLLIYGDADRRVTLAQARKLRDAAGLSAQLWVVRGATHNAIQSQALVQLAPNIIAFLNQSLRHSQEHQMVEVPARPAAFPSGRSWLNQRGILPTY